VSDPKEALAVAEGATETKETEALVPHDAAVTGSTALEVFASGTNFDTAQRIAKALAASALLPKEYNGNVANCLIVLEIAGRVGCSALAVAQNLDIIHGRPGWRAAFLIATVNASGRFTPLRWRFEGKAGQDLWGCRAVAKSKDDGEECLGPLITIAMAKAEGWATKSGSKWQTLPELMLQYRAAAFWTRLFAPELSLGMSTVEELHDIAPVNMGPAVVVGSRKALEDELLGRVPHNKETGEVT
jgi:hypothetical protein